MAISKFFLGIILNNYSDTGIYVLMFEAIFKTFLKVIILTVLLIVTFALTFYMAFNQFIPRFARSPFASPITSIWKTMTMATGELDYDDIFRQSTTDSMSDAPDIPFPTISYIMWVIFLILMPILFTNLLVSSITQCVSTNKIIESMVWAGPMTTLKFGDTLHSHIEEKSTLKVCWANMP